MVVLLYYVSVIINTHTVLQNMLLVNKKHIFADEAKVSSTTLGVSIGV